MRSSFLLGALCAMGAIASPIEKRVYTTEVIVITVTETITPWLTQSTPSATVATTAAVTPSSEIDVAEKYRYSSSSSTTSSPSAVVTTYAPPPTTSATTPSASSPVQVSTLSSAAPSPTAGNSYQETILQNHNIHRANHSAPALVWDSGLEASAQQLANGCVYEHNT